MMDKKLKNKIYTNTIFVLIIIAIIYFFIYPQYSGSGIFYSPTKNISSLLKEKDDYDNAINIAKDYQNKIIKTNDNYSNSLNTLPIDVLNKVLPNSADPVLVIYELSRIAAKPDSNMLLTSPTFTDDSNNQSNKKYNTLSVSFSLEGTYENIKTFLKNLEKSERVFNVTNLSFSSNQDTKAISPLKYNITVETYYLKQN